jgi:hypothetical protein
MMQAQLMIDSHDLSECRADWTWALPAGNATRLTAEARPRYLAVTRGMAWLTRTGAEPGDDRWVAAGGGMLLPEGSEWVVEGRDGAAFALYQLPLSAAAGPSPLAWLRSAWQRLGTAASPAPQRCGA